MAERPRGMGRGLAAILSSTTPPDGDEPMPELRQLPTRADRAQSAPAAPGLRRGVAARPGGFRARARPAPAGPRAPARGRHLRADRRRAPLARRPARRARRRARARARARRPRVAGARADREHGPRGPQPGRRGPGLRAAGRRARPHPRGRRAPRRPLPRRRLEPDAPARPPGRRARPARRRPAHEGHGRALLTAPDHDDRRRLGRQAAEEGWTVRQTEARCRDEAARPRSASAAPPHTRTRSRPPSASRTPCPPPSARDIRVAPRGEGYTVTLSLADAEALAERLGALERT